MSYNLAIFNVYLKEYFNLVRIMLTFREGAQKIIFTLSFLYSKLYSFNANAW